MDSPLKRVVLISGLGIFALIACVSLNITGSADSDRCTNLFAHAYAADSPGAEAHSHPWRSEFPKFNRRLDGHEFIVGVLLTSLGLIAIVLACLRWNTKDLSLLSFGAFCLLWGARTNLFRPGIRLSTEIRILRVGFVTAGYLLSSQMVALMPINSVTGC